MPSTTQQKTLVHKYMTAVLHVSATVVIFREVFNRGKSNYGYSCSSCANIKLKHTC